jgi:outer membrane protein OmpA-like peptidoglycan-associated protein
LITAGTFALLAGCAGSNPPRELVEARTAYDRASAGQAARRVRPELREARVALQLAELSFDNEEVSVRTCSLATAAHGKALAADSLATALVARAIALRETTPTEHPQVVLKNGPRADATTSGRSGAAPLTRAAGQHITQRDAETRDIDVSNDLGGLATAREESRGLVWTMWGNMLFSSNESTLLPQAEQRLNKLAALLVGNRDHLVTIEGHMDSWGLPVRNKQLSQKRAEAVRSHLITRGYPANMIQARGMGDERPIADNARPEGRANNQRLEIIIAHTGH